MATVLDERKSGKTRSSKAKPKAGKPHLSNLKPTTSVEKSKSSSTNTVQQKGIIHLFKVAMPSSVASAK